MDGQSRRIRTYDRTVGELQSIGYHGQPVQQAFRRVDPPVAVFVDLAALFPREPHHPGGYHPAGLQMHSVVDGRLTCWGICEQGSGGAWSPTRSRTAHAASP
jgi:hypothetical protein